MVAKLLASKPAQWAGVALAALSAVPMIGHLLASEGLAECNPYDPETRDHIWYINGLHDGWTRGISGDTPVSTRANILVRDVYVSTIPPVEPWFSTAWVMLNNPGNPNIQSDNRWAQIGWIEYVNNDRRTVVQMHTLGDPYDDPTTLFYAPYAVDSSPKYRVDYLPPSGGYPAAFQFYVNFFPLYIDWAGFVPSEAEQYGEINILSTQMPGGYNQHEKFTNSELKLQSTGVYEHFKGIEMSDSYAFAHDKISFGELHIWDTACAT